MKKTATKETPAKRYMARMERLSFTVTPEFYRDFAESAERLRLTKIDFLREIFELGWQHFRLGKK